MQPALVIDSDFDQLVELFTRVFSDSEGPMEGTLVGTLASDLLLNTEAKDLYGVKAVEQNEIIGSILFTTLTFENDINAFLMAPVAIDTNHQRKGIGQTLIKFGIHHLKEKGVKLVFTYGDPAYYSKAGFKAIDESIAGAPFKLSRPEGWLCQSLVDSRIEPLPGKSQCVDAFNKPEYW